ncbi:spike base protein, RCAP_Rcc01079 family [Pararhodobacter zhoushanensis]|uniref:Uncharacterized protein n=1 Tax=Pararhodobacter zhoushanensis TaxID=2479545 RepID=A0ABT3H3Y8_9RHOB|nr:hypothetical protein [Pararhodobacter zhoushanensis]MCW1934521.1 hypothetical protein [Pararhodobacter zhoushanensis]
MKDKATHISRHNGSPGENLWPITPSDDADLAFVTRGLYVGGDGDLMVIPWNGGELGDPVPIVGVLAGSLLPFRVARVLATGTTATNIVGID